MFIPERWYYNKTGFDHGLTHPHTACVQPNLHFQTMLSPQRSVAASMPGEGNGASTAVDMAYMALHMEEFDSSP